ncbi:MAG: type IV conjugative transfer system protein TraE [Succinivibrionaceae bacterium]|nr:type IV conjugative transfer system protein TraE [Succinivibrionaceae bacterium]
MELKKYLKTYEGARKENYYSRISLIICLVIIFILLMAVLTKRTIVTIAPYTLTSDSWVSNSSGANSYKEAWALFFAQELGNITPDTIDFVTERIGPLLSPAIYHDFMAIIHSQAEHIKEDRVSLRFEARSVTYEPETDKTFVTGYLYTRSVSGKELHDLRTYEFEIGIRNFAPVLVSMNTYNDQPRTLRQIQLEESRRKSREERENARK